VRTKLQNFLNDAEKLFAEHLKSLGLDYIYQPTKFCLGDTSYCPDFYIPALTLYFEVVGTRQAIAQRRHKIELLQELYPFVFIRIVNPDGSPYELGKIRVPPKSIGDQPLTYETPIYRHRKIFGKPENIRVCDISRILDKRYHEVYEKLKNGEIPGCYRKNGHYFVKRADFEAWLEKQKKIEK